MVTGANAIPLKNQNLIPKKTVFDRLVFPRVSAFDRLTFDQPDHGGRGNSSQAAKNTANRKERSTDPPCNPPKGGRLMWIPKDKA